MEAYPVHRGGGWSIPTLHSTSLCDLGWKKSASLLTTLLTPHVGFPTLSNCSLLCRHPLGVLRLIDFWQLGVGTDPPTGEALSPTRRPPLQMSAAGAESSDYSHFFLIWLQIRVPTSLFNKVFITAHSGKLFTYSCQFVIKDIIKGANEQQCEDEVWKGPESECFCSCGICLTPSCVHPLEHRTCVYVWHLCAYTPTCVCICQPGMFPTPAI